MGPSRFSRVPWLNDAIDLRAFGPPECSVSVSDQDLSLGLHIPAPFGRDTDAMLTVHAMTGNGNDGGVITLAISHVVYRREEAPEPKKKTTKFYPSEDGA